MDIRTIWDQTPNGTKTAVAAAILGFVVTVSSHSQTVAGGVLTQCSYTNYGALGFAAITAIATGFGVLQNPRRHENLRLSSQVLFPFSAVLLAVAVIHVLRGFGTVGGEC